MGHREGGRTNARRRGAARGQRARVDKVLRGVGNRTDGREAAVEVRINPPNAVDQRRVGREQLEKRGRQSVAEEHVAGLLGPWCSQSRAVRESADLLERSRNAVGKPRELHRGSIRQEFALPRHRAFDQMRKKHADVADDQQAQSQERQWIAPFLVVVR